VTALAEIEARGGAAGRAAAAFRAAIAGGRLGQTYIIFGPTGAGKMELARAVAEAAACVEPLPSGDACGGCPACSAGTRGAEADLRVLAPLEGKREILIDQVREAIAELALAPMVGRVRTLIVEGVDRLRDEGANALLKTLEEPPERALLLLLSARPDAVLPTIRSRALEVRLAARAARRGARSPAAEAAARALLGEGAEVPQDPYERAAIAVGAIEQAAARDEAAGGTRLERVRRAVLEALDTAAEKLREVLRARATSGAGIIDTGRAIEAVLFAAERIEANATPKLVLEVLALDLATCGAAV
jgi:DNA polymerase-3 subunit delta'